MTQFNTSIELRSMLSRMDHRGYPAYKELRGAYRFPGFILSIDHVQGDPFAAPSRLSVRVEGSRAGFPEGLYKKACRRLALQDELIRAFRKQAEAFSFKAGGSGQSGLISVSRCGQEVLERTACHMDERTGDIILRLEMGFPARGRTIDAKALDKMLFEFLPKCIEASLLYKNADPKKLEAICDLAEDQAYIRSRLPELGLCAFAADGSILPRESGVSQKPMREAVAFEAPEEMAVELELPHRGRIRGMGIPKGITLIVGGGYHGKSTLLRALELGVYDHIRGDGREYVITDRTAMKIRAEDGRSIKHTDISMFINDLPNGKDTRAFVTEDASGSTSQAANVVESIESGSKLLLIDEDTSATNFMVRDELMQRVISRDKEPITPLIDRIRGLYEKYGISSIIVAGSSGAYFDVADHVIMMDRYVPKDITAAAKKEAELYHRELEGGRENKKSKAPASDICLGSVSGQTDAEKMPNERTAAGKADKTADFKTAADITDLAFDRRPRASQGFRDGDRIKLKNLGLDGLLINRENIDLRYLEQLADIEQTAALGYCLIYAEKHLMDGRRTLQEIVDELEKLMDEKGLWAITESRTAVPSAARPRRQEIFGCFDRFRGLRM